MVDTDVQVKNTMGMMDKFAVFGEEKQEAYNDALDGVLRDLEADRRREQSRKEIRAKAQRDRVKYIMQKKQEQLAAKRRKTE